MALLTRDRIVAAARHSVERDGYEALSLRSLAQSLEVTAPALYDHVDSKADVLRAVAEQGYLELAAASAVDQAQPIDRVRARALAYVRFAQDRPELFRVMFLYRPDAVMVEADNELPAASDAFAAGLDDLAAAVASGDLVGRDPLQLGLILWAAIHGVATISLLAPTVAHDVAENVVDAMLAGLRPEPSA